MGDDKALREAAERFRADNYPRAAVSRGRDWDSFYEHIQRHSDMETLAAVYLADHPADDALPVDAAFLAGLGFKTMHGWVEIATERFELYAQPIETEWVWRIVRPDGNEPIELPRQPTRGQLRALLLALGIEVPRG